ncbi:hypothetical protein [Curtobacterium sp. MCBD17_040]|uniref:hypothetical protein n=1 Tax=Curtobacterium sp. MCBD17_040 TaxID=2175674 RepID=UPI000DAA8DA6|nr:hypothetical protein [Curtobacterium sp. MCBD17_040]WIB65305.1 hypothetical protein DEI94_18030 [Curtobacterium sp. MCBD17_040]
MLKLLIAFVGKALIAAFIVVCVVIALIVVFFKPLMILLGIAGTVGCGVLIVRFIRQMRARLREMQRPVQTKALQK